MVSLVKFDVEHVKLSGYEFGRKLTFQFVKTMHLVLPSPEAQPAPRVHSSLNQHSKLKDGKLVKDLQVHSS